MAATETGVWTLQEVRDKQLASEWSYDGEQQLFMAGQNTSGLLGQNSTTTQYSSPVQIYGGGSTWSEIITPNNGSRALALKTDGTMWTWGHNQYGQLGLGFVNPGNTGRSSPCQVPGTNWHQAYTCYRATYGLKTYGTLWAWGRNDQGQLGQNNTDNYSSPRQIPGTTWSTTGRGPGDNALMGWVKTDGTLWMWGKNEAGGMGTNKLVA